MPKTSTAEFEPGLTVLYKGDMYTIVERRHHKPGKGGAVMRTKLRHVKHGNVIDITFKSGEVLEEVPLETLPMQYLYKDEQSGYFMHPETFEQKELPLAVFAGNEGYMKEGEMFALVLDDQGTPITIKFPKKVTLKVTEAPEAVKGDTTTNTYKEVTLETGLKIKAPLFIKPGDMLVINTESGEYVERA